MNVLGIDPSTKTGLVRVINGLEYATVLNYPRTTGIHRVQSIAQGFENYLDDESAPAVAVIEGYAFANRYTLATLVEVGVILRLSLHRRGITCYIAPPSVVKKFATGKGNSKKPEVAAAVKDRWGFENPSDDVVDAYVMAQMALSVASNGPKIVGLELLT